MVALNDKMASELGDDDLMSLPPDCDLDKLGSLFSTEFPSFQMDPSSKGHRRKHSNNYKNLSYSATGLPKDLSHVPCKFFKVGACAAGASCPFSHNLPEPGQGKSVCQWFVKGNCKFGHKCALAHILPGQAMSMDRRNKRAAQAAAREAAAAAASVNGEAPPSNTGSTAPPTNKSSKSTHGRSHSALPAPIGISTTGISVSSPGPQVSPTTTRLSSALSSMLEKPSSSSMSNIPVVSTTATTSITPVMSNGTFGEDGIGIVNAGTGGASAVATMQNLLGMTAGGTIRGRPAGLRADGGGITHGMNIRRDPSPFHNHNADSTPISMSPHDPPMFTNQGYGADSSDFYEQQARRQSFSSNGRSVSPAARIESLKSGYQVPVGAQMYNSNGLSISPPNPTPINLGSQAPMSSNIFSTSPFSAPGQKSLFFSQSYEGHDESRFAGRSLPVLDEIHQRQQIKTGMLRSPFDSDDDEDLEFVPSSLSELLTVEEMHRRTARQSFGQQSGLLRRPNGTGMNGGGQSSAGGAGSFDPFDQPLSRSVPLDSMLFNRQVGSGSNGMTGMMGLGDDMGRTSTNPNVVGSQRPSLLQQTSNPTYTPSHLTLQQQLLRGMAPSGGVNGNTNYGVNDYRSYLDSRHEVDELSLANIISPGRARTLRDHAPGSSLPQGLAAGLSRLHLTPAQHTGETPPSSFSQSGYVHPVLSPTSPTSLDPNNPRTSNFSPQSWGSDPPSPHGFNVIGGGANPPGLKLPSSYSRRLGGGPYQFTSPLSKPGKNYEDSKDSLGAGSLVSPSQAGLSSPKHSLFDDGIFDMDGINA